MPSSSGFTAFCEEVGRSPPPITNTVLLQELCGVICYDVKRVKNENGFFLKLLCLYLLGQNLSYNVHFNHILAVIHIAVIMSNCHL